MSGMQRQGYIGFLLNHICLITNSDQVDNIILIIDLGCFKTYTLCNNEKAVVSHSNMI